MDDDAFDTNVFSADAWEFFGAAISFVRSLLRTVRVGADCRVSPVATALRNETPEA